MKAKSSEQESVNEVMNRVSHADLLSYYLGIDSLPVLISSPLRSNDRHPSFFIFSPDGNRVLYRDYATGDKGDIYSLIQKKNNLSFSELIREIAKNKKFSDTNDSVFSVSNSNSKHFTKTTIDLRVKIRDWNDDDIRYWESFGITLKWLKYAEVYPISHKIIYKNNSRYVFRAAKYAYDFVERKENIITHKIYQPFNKDYKWTTSHNGSVVGLWTKVPQKGDRLVICSSLKDALCLWINIMIPAIYVQSETTGLSETACNNLKSRFNKVFICFDNDAPGLADGIALSEKTGFINVVLPQFEGGKDISDLYKTKGKEEFIRIVKPLFDNCG